MTDKSMTYFSPETCKQLEQLGCVASSGMWWKNGNHTQDKLLDSFSVIKEHEQLLLKRVCPAYSNADFLSSPSAKENCIKVFGENGVRYGKFEWKHNARQLLDIILNGGDGESFIKEALEAR